MSLKQGNNLFKNGDYEKALMEYQRVASSSPLYSQAQFNIERTTKLLKKMGAAPTQLSGKSPELNVTFVGVQPVPQIKGIPPGNCLAYSVSGIEKNCYYQVIVSTEISKNIIISIRNCIRNLPLYQSSAEPVKKSDHIFFVPPSATRDLIVSLYFNESLIELSGMADNILLTINKIEIDGPMKFKPEGLNKPVIASMTTIENRLDIAIDAVYSLLAQVDRVYVHINDMSTVPSALMHDRIVVTTEDRHGNLGDAGKFVGARCEDDAYILVCDDDFIYPYDFLLQSYLRLAREDHQVVIGMHGIFLRYPMQDYYADDARNTMHCTTGFSFEATVGVVGTGVIFFDSKVFPSRTFFCDYKNMADIWFSLTCNRLQIPILIQKRRSNWLIDNPPSESAAAIWRHSNGNVSSEANTRAMQTFVLKSTEGYPVSLPINNTNLGRDFLLVVDFDFFSKSIDCLVEISKTVYAPAAIVVRNVKDLLSARKIGRSIYCDLILFSDQPGLTKLREKTTGVRHQFLLELSGNFLITQGKLSTLIDLIRSNQSLLSDQFDLAIFSDGIDEIGHVRFLIAADSPNNWPDKADARNVAPFAEKVHGIFRQAAKSRSQTEINLSKNSKSRSASLTSTNGGFSNYFDKVYLLNLERRPDRLAEFGGRASKWGIEFERVVAVDGGLPEVRDQYSAIQERIAKLYGPKNHAFKYESSSYWEYTSEAERISHLLTKNSKTYSAGGYGYLRTYRNIIEDAIINNYDRIAVFDDDCLFHKNLDELFLDLISVIPNDWVTISLGTLQYDWRDKYVNWASQNAYRCGGFSVGSHAQAYSKTALPMLLEFIDRYTLPFDVGPLHYLKRFYSTKSFVAYPNLFIQDVGDTDIGDSSVQLSEGAKNDNIYKWRLNDYE